MACFQNKERRLHEKSYYIAETSLEHETLGVERKMAFKSHRSSLFTKGSAQSIVLPSFLFTQLNLSL